ncbi:MAG: phosphatidylserine decarboxylase [Alphaproteobacteria bacterium]
MEMLKMIIPSIHREGYYFITIFAIVSLLVGYFIQPLGWMGAILTIWCVFFFRNPDRVTPVGENFIISPADGLVQKIEFASPPKELNIGDEEMLRVSIFLNVFDVHVNRIPVSGTVKTLSYRPGKFINASFDKASVDNERQAVLVTTKDGYQIAFTQIAGLIARRIVCELEEGEQVQAGERFGLIRFGSRMDVYLPKNVNPLVMVGQRSVGGETIIAELNNNYPKREGEIR